MSPALYELVGACSLTLRAPPRTLHCPHTLQATCYWTVGNVLGLSPLISHGRRLLSKRAITIIFAGADLFALL